MWLPTCVGLGIATLNSERWFFVAIDDKLRRQEPRTRGRARELEVMGADGRVTRDDEVRHRESRCVVLVHRVDELIVEEDVHGVAQCV